MERETLIRKTKIVRYPKWEIEADKQLIKEMAEIINTLKDVTQDKEQDEQKKDSNS